MAKSIELLNRFKPIVIGKILPKKRELMEFRTPSQLKVAELGAAEGGVTDMIVVRQLKTLDAVFEKTDASLVVLCFSASFAGGSKTAKELTKLAKDFGTADVSFISVHINEGEYDGQELIIAEYGVEDFPTCVFIKPAEVRILPYRFHPPVVSSGADTQRELCR